MRSLQPMKCGCVALFLVLTLHSVAALIVVLDHRAGVEARTERDQNLKVQIEASSNIEALRTAATEYLELSRMTEKAFSAACVSSASVSAIVAINLVYYWFLILRAEREFRRVQKE